VTDLSVCNSRFLGETQPCQPRPVGPGGSPIGWSVAVQAPAGLWDVRGAARLTRCSERSHYARGFFSLVNPLHDEGGGEQGAAEAESHRTKTPIDQTPAYGPPLGIGESRLQYGAQRAKAQGKLQGGESGTPRRRKWNSKEAKAELQGGEGGTPRRRRCRGANTLSQTGRRDIFFLVTVVFLG